MVRRWALLLLITLPFAAHIGRSILVQAVWASGFAVFGASAWIAGLVAANVRFHLWAGLPLA